MACFIGAPAAADPGVRALQLAYQMEGQPKCTEDEDLVEFDDGSYIGFKDKTGRVVIPAVFTFVMCFLDTGMAGVVGKDGWIYIDRQGKQVIRPFVFDNGPDYFSEGLARFVKDGKMGFFDTHGRVVIDAKFEWVEPFSNGLARFCVGCERQYDGEHWMMVGGKWGTIDKLGKVIDVPE